ncbi:MAG: transposase [Caulobacter sp.]
MPRTARIVVPGAPHHVTQRGNRREPIFFQPGDQAVYLRILSEQARRRDVGIWAYCLMPNHVHLILTPRDESGLASTVGETHRRYTSFINGRAGWTGHLFQSRYASVAMDDAHFITAARYVALNPVRAGLVERPEAWPWSSVHAHLAGTDDGVVTVGPLLSRVERFADTLDEGPDEQAFLALRNAEISGAPLGDKVFFDRIGVRGQVKMSQGTP